METWIIIRHISGKCLKGREKRLKDPSDERMRVSNVFNESFSEIKSSGKEILGKTLVVVRFYTWNGF